MFINDTLIEEDVALKEVDDGMSSILFQDVLVSRLGDQLDESDYLIIR